MLCIYFYFLRKMKNVHLNLQSLVRKPKKKEEETEEETEITTDNINNKLNIRSLI